MTILRSFFLTYWPPLFMGAIYIVIVGLIGSFWIAPRDAPANYISTRTLQTNRRLVKEDFQRIASGAESYGWFLPDRSELEGKYVRGADIKAGSPVKLENLRQTLDMTMRKGFRPVLVSLDDLIVLSEEVNAGASVDIENTAGIVAKDMTVHGVTCSTPSGLSPSKASGCVAVIDVPVASDACIFRGIKGLHIVLRNVANETK